MTTPGSVIGLRLGHHDGDGDARTARPRWSARVLPAQAPWHMATGATALATSGSTETP